MIDIDDGRRDEKFVEADDGNSCRRRPIDHPERTKSRPVQEGGKRICSCRSGLIRGFFQCRGGSRRQVPAACFFPLSYGKQVLSSSPIGHTQQEKAVDKGKAVRKVCGKMETMDHEIQGTETGAEQHESQE